MVSFFALTLSCVNSGSRILMPLAKHGFVHRRLHGTHATNLTPHSCIAAVLRRADRVRVHLARAGWQRPHDVRRRGHAGRDRLPVRLLHDRRGCAVYLRKLGELKQSHIVVAVAGFLLLLVPLVGLFYPLPAFPVDIFPAIFAAFMLLGGGWLYVLNMRVPGTLVESKHRWRRRCRRRRAPPPMSSQARASGSRCRAWASTSRPPSHRRASS